MLTIIYYLSFATLLCASAANGECSAKEKTADYLCKTLDKHFKHDNGKLAKYVCGCATGFMLGNYDYCKASEYHFSDAPDCEALLKSVEFKEVTNSKAGVVSKYFAEVIGRNIYNVCDEPNEDVVVDSIIGVFNNPIIIAAAETAVRYGLDFDIGQKLIHCYREYQRLAKDEMENLLIPPHLLD